MTLKEYLQERYRSQTVGTYLKEIKQYIKAVGEAKAKAATYQDMINYVGILRENYSSMHTIVAKLTGIKSYYGWLVHSKKRKDHPCRNIYLKDSRSKPLQLQDLFTPTELSLMEESTLISKTNGSRNKIIMSLLIHQGATAMEIIKLKVEDINLEQASIALKYGEKIQPRTLPLLPKQIMLINNYLTNERKKENPTTFMITSTGACCCQVTVYNAVRKLKSLFPEKPLSTQSIRQSVIANLLKAGKGLRVVQEFAGHKHVISTEKYKQQGIEQLKTEIDKYHPLK